jgi:hypothetical protein
MKPSPLTKTLLKIFVAGFYRVHAGLLMMMFFVMFGMIEPGQLFNYEKTLMLAFLSSPFFMFAVFVVWLLYAIKAFIYVSGQINAANQQFLFYSSNVFDRRAHFKSWFVTQTAIMLPILTYALVAVFAAIWYHYYLAAFSITLYLLVLTAGSAALYIKQVNRLVDGSQQSFILQIANGWKKPFFSLFIYHVFDKLKVHYLLSKILSLLIIIMVFYLFADVQHDVRVAGIAMLGVVTAHMVIIYQNHNFESVYLSFARNLPYHRWDRFLNVVVAYLFLLLPECVWLFYRFNPAIAVQLLLLGLSLTLLFRSIIYAIGLNMDKYLQWVLGLFIVLFWVIMFKILWVLTGLNIAVAYFIFYKRYYAVN